MKTRGSAMPAVKCPESMERSTAATLFAGHTTCARAHRGQNGPSLVSGDPFSHHSHTLPARSGVQRFQCRRFAECLTHRLRAAGNASLMTQCLVHTLCEHSFGNPRALLNRLANCSTLARNFGDQPPAPITRPSKYMPAGPSLRGAAHRGHGPAEAAAGRQPQHRLIV